MPDVLTETQRVALLAEARKALESLLKLARDSRLSNEFIGNVLRSRLEALAAVLEPDVSSHDYEINPLPVFDPYPTPTALQESPTVGVPADHPIGQIAREGEE